MKKILVRIAIALAVLVLLAALGMHFFLNGAIKRGVETLGPKLTKTEVKLNTVSLSLFSGSGKMKGLLVGNPEGFKTPSAINVGSTSVELQPGSLFSDKVLIKSIVVEGPEVTFETDLRSVNLKTILGNVEQAAGGTEKQPSQPKEPQAKAGRKLQVDDFRITGGKVHVTVTVLGGQSATVNLPEIQLKDLGQGPEGITAAELSKRILQILVEKAEQQAVPMIADLTKGGKILPQGLPTSGTDTVEKVTKGLGDLIKKKP